MPGQREGAGCARPLPLARNAFALRRLSVLKHSADQLVQLGAFLVGHLWRFDRFRCLK